MFSTFPFINDTWRLIELYMRLCTSTVYCLVEKNSQITIFIHPFNFPNGSVSNLGPSGFHLISSCVLSLSPSVHPQMWLRMRRVWARGCWTWRSRRSKGRASWRSWRNSWGSTQPRARSLTPNYSIFCMSVKRVQLCAIFESCLALFTLSFVSILNPLFRFLQQELESLRNTEHELQTLENEVDEDTTEVIPSAV